MDKMAYLGDYTILTKLAFGPKIYLDTRDVSITPHLILDGIWEPWVTKQFISMVKPGMIVLDIGANCGYYSLLAAHMVGLKGTVHSFEPDPFHHENFMKSKAINGYNQLHLHKVALTDKTEEIMLYSPVKLKGGASIYGKHLSEILDDKVSDMKVPAVKLSEYLPNLKADIIKIDIEGAEPLVMDSLFEVIDNSGEVRIIMEYNPTSWDTNGFDSESIFNRFIQRDFQIQIIQHDGNLLFTAIKDLIQKGPIGTHFDLCISNTKR